ncbi:MAG: TonB-dependent receptor, partial [Bacteroidia bacterium]|nr:TonB-dependent receptor [Bacteroidia bacterium]
MKAIKLFTCTFFLLLIGFNAFAQQKYVVSGKVVDELSQPLAYATVLLLQASDSVMAEFSVTNNKGVFQLKGIQFGKYLLQTSFLGYSTTSNAIEVGSNIDYGEIQLLKVDKDLKGVDIEAEVVPITIKEDTVEYNSAAFKTQPNANVEDLLKKLPGVTVEKDGSITTQGEQVQKVLVDGKEFFGNDPKIATKNLPADAVDKIQVFDEKSDFSEFTGVDDGERTKTINLLLKEGKKSGYFGNATAGYGVPDDVYEGKLTLNRFTRSTQLSVLGMANNINDQGFSFNDYVNFMGGFRSLMESGLGTFQNGRPSAGLSSSLNSGITDALAGGLNFNYDLSKNTDLRTSYFYNKIQNTLLSTTERQYFNNANNYNTNSSTRQSTDIDNHRFNYRFKHDFSKRSDIKVKGTLLYNEGSTTLIQDQKSIDETGATQNNNSSSNVGTGDSYDGDAELTYRQKFTKKGRSIVLRGSLAIANDDLQSSLNAINNYTTYTDSILQRQFYFKDQLELGARTSYVEPLGKGRYIEINYRYQQQQSDLNKDFFDVDPSDDSQVLNENLTNKYDNTYRYNSAGVNYRLDREKYNASIGLDGQISELDGNLISTGQMVNRTYRNLLPNFRLNYQFAGRKRLRFNYETAINAPSIEQLQPIVDNSNPLQVYEGNPNLDAE